MKLENKKELVARALKIGKNRISFNPQRLSELKEAITKQDIKYLKDEGVILIKEKKGRRQKIKRKTRRRAGSIKQKARKGKREYVLLTRKLRSYLAHLKKMSQINIDDYKKLRKEIKTRAFRSLAHMKEHISQLGSEKATKTGGKKHAKNAKTKKKRSKN